MIGILIFTSPESKTPLNIKSTFSDSHTSLAFGLDFIGSELVMSTLNVTSFV